ncbi:MAG TPA: class I SAM-dependent methyltransferase [Fluviicoccus sp.]|nr:class I SAM-dependent methyltransferase [Fluviicoccus sp.]
MADTDSSGISFTAYYTSEVWRQHGLSAPAFHTREGKTLWWLGRPVEWFAEHILGVSNDVMLLQRHLIIDDVVRRAIREDGVSQIVEIACGLSPRGTRFCAEFPDLHYLEADLPGMAAHKQKLLARGGLSDNRHRVAAINILEENTPEALNTVFSRELDPSRKTLVITEGLVNYFDLTTISGFWQRLAAALKTFPEGLYVTDLYPDFKWHPVTRFTDTFIHGLALVTRSRVSLHFGTEEAIHQGFHACGFRETAVHLPESYYGVLPIPVQRLSSLVRVIENRV